MTIANGVGAFTFPYWCDNMFDSVYPFDVTISLQDLYGSLQALPDDLCEYKLSTSCNLLQILNKSTSWPIVQNLALPDTNLLRVLICHKLYTTSQVL